MIIRHLWGCVVITLFLSACSTSFNVSQLDYNKDLDLFEYPLTPDNIVFPRNADGYLLDSSRITFFIEQEILPEESCYNLEQSLEDDQLLLSVDDIELAAAYARMNKAITDKTYEQALSEINFLEAADVRMECFSDIYLFKAIAYEALAYPDSAQLYYARFLHFSSGKYAKRFRGYRDADIDNRLWQEERQYAKDKLKGESSADYNAFIKPITPRYRHNSFHPGFVLDMENYDHDNRWINSVVPGYNHERFELAYFMNTKLYQQVDFSFCFKTDGDNSCFGFAFPLQLFQTENARLGVKATPFAGLNTLKTLPIDGYRYDVNQNVPYFGIKLSAAYSLTSRWSLGVYYTHHLHNEYNPYVLNNGLYYYYNNIYDLSLYYALNKKMSLKAGVKNGDVVAGLYWSGWEIAYNISHSGVILKFDLY